MNVNITRGTKRRAWKERRTRREWRTAYKDLRAHYRYLTMDIGRLLSVMYISQGTWFLLSQGPCLLLGLRSWWSGLENSP